MTPVLVEFLSASISSSLSGEVTPVYLMRSMPASTALRKQSQRLSPQRRQARHRQRPRRSQRRRWHPALLLSQVQHNKFTAEQQKMPSLLKQGRHVYIVDGLAIALFGQRSPEVLFLHLCSQDGLG